MKAGRRQPKNSLLRKSWWQLFLEQQTASHRQRCPLCVMHKLCDFPSYYIALCEQTDPKVYTKLMQ